MEDNDDDSVYDTQRDRFVDLMFSLHQLRVYAEHINVCREYNAIAIDCVSIVITIFF